MANYRWIPETDPEREEIQSNIKILSLRALRNRYLFRDGEISLYLLLENSRQLRELKIRLRQLDKH